MKFTLSWLKEHLDTIATADAIAAVAARIPLSDLTVREPEMESILRQIYESPGAMA